MFTWLLGSRRALDSCIQHSLRLGLLIVMASCLAPRTVSAQVLERLSLRGEIGLGSMLTRYQRDELDLKLLVQGTGRIGFNLTDALALQVSYGSWRFPAEDSGQVHSFTGGVRFEPMLGELGRFVVDGNFGHARTGELGRFTLDAGLGFEFALTRAFGLGPIVRYGQVLRRSVDHPRDARYWSAGLGATLRLPKSEPDKPRLPDTDSPDDTDGDGVPDPDDHCPEQPAGKVPDPDRPGCPLDSDGDGVIDEEDRCVDEPAGEHPDPKRPGCPMPDADGDGVFDPDDQCPTTPQGEHPDPERPGCPAGDDDGDGVLNHEDQCPQQHHGMHPDPERPGCPLPDRDGDSVPDAVDACPDEAGAPSEDPKLHGCPGLVRVKGAMIEISRPVFFATNKNKVLPRSAPVLRAIADVLKATPMIRRVAIEGHTDDVGDANTNLELSKQRAHNVMQWLIKAGVEPERLESHGYGQSRPRQPGTSRKARAANRRVDFRILDPKIEGADSTGGSK